MNEVESLFYDKNFREKVKLIESFIASQEPSYKELLHQAMLDKLTEEQRAVYWATVEDLKL